MATKYDPIVTSDYLVSQGACYIGRYIRTPWSHTLSDILVMETIPEKDRIWVASKMLPDKQLRYFAIWCAREAIALQDINNIDSRTMDVLWFAEEYANGNLHENDLSAARAAAGDAAGAAARAAAGAAAGDAAGAAARAAARAAAGAAAGAAARAAAWAAARAAAWAAAWAAAEDAQIECLKRLINGEHILEEN